MVLKGGQMGSIWSEKGSKLRGYGLRKSLISTLFTSKDHKNFLKPLKYLKPTFNPIINP